MRNLRELYVLRGEVLFSGSFLYGILRGLENVKGEFNLVAMAWNLKRMFVLAG